MAIHAFGYLRCQRVINSHPLVHVINEEHYPNLPRKVQRLFITKQTGKPIKCISIDLDTQDTHFNGLSLFHSFFFLPHLFPAPLSVSIHFTFLLTFSILQLYLTPQSHSKPICDHQLSFISSRDNHCLYSRRPTCKAYFSFVYIFFFSLFN